MLRTAQILRTLIPVETGPRKIGVTSAEPDTRGEPTRVAPWVALAGTALATAGAATFYVFTQDAIDQRDASRTGSAWVRPIAASTSMRSSRPRPQTR